ncbi:hypothetical protein NGRA_3297, partial [Nosema granulosis]
SYSSKGNVTENKVKVPCTEENISCEELKKQLKEGLEEQEINNEEELRRQIKRKKEEMEASIAEGKQKTAQKRKDSLTKLEKLQLLAERIKFVERYQPTDDYEELKRKLAMRLEENDISNADEVKKQIIKKKEEIETLLHEGKPNEAKKRQDSLAKLEDIQLLSDHLKSHEEKESKFFRLDLNQDELQITKESLSNLYEDFFSMPLCSERHVLSLLLYVSLKCVDKKIVFDKTFIISDEIEKEIENEFQNLKQRLKFEEVLSSEIQNLTDELDTNLRKKSWKYSLIQLREIFRKINPLNMYDLFRLVDKVDNIAQSIKDKDIIFFLGGTGSGKSTTIHFLAGSKMKVTYLNGIKHIAPVEIINPDLIKITTSPFARSETRQITPVTVNYEDVKAYNTGSIILCDSPGFEDTNGAEIDIANGIGIVKAIKGCRTVKPVVLVSYRSIGDRFEGLKHFTRVFAGLIPGIRDQIRTFSYLFTKYPKDERSTIHAALENVRQLLTPAEKSDTSFMNLFNDMLHKTEDGALVIDPIKGKPGEILDELAESTAIHHPDKVFQFSITEKSKGIVQEQIRKQHLSILSAAERDEYLLVQYKLDQLKRLNNLLNIDYIEKTYIDCVRHVSKRLVEEYEEATSRLNRCLFHQTSLNDKDIQHYKACIAHARIAQDLKETHLGKEIIHSSAFSQYLDQQMNMLVEDLKEKQVNDSSVKITLDKMKLISHYTVLCTNQYCIS